MRRTLTKLLSEDHPLIEKRSCKRRDNNERPRYQNVCVSFSSAALSFDSVLAVARAEHCRSAWGCLHLSPRSTEIAERSSQTKSRLNDSRGDLRGMNLPCSIALKIGSPVGLIFGNTAGSSLSPTYFSWCALWSHLKDIVKEAVREGLKERDEAGYRTNSTVITCSYLSLLRSSCATAS
jgi:hypothetical protein